MAITNEVRQRINQYAVDYTGPHTWNAEEPITADNVNNMEAGIAEALREIYENTLNLEALTTRVGNDEDTINSAVSIVNRMSTSVTQLEANVIPGQNAWNQISPLLEDGLTLPQIITGIQTNADALNTTVAAHTNALTAAANGALDSHGAISLAARLAQMDTKNEEQDLVSSNISTELINARQGKTYLVNNLNDIRSLISANASSITDLNNAITNGTAVDIQKIQNKIGYTDAETIDASPATNLKQIITKVGQDAQTYTNNKTSEITGAHRSGVANDTLNQRFTDLESADTTINNSIDAIEARLDDIDGNESGTIHSRLAAVETEIDNANNDGTLNDRFEAIEDDITAINGVNGTIAGLNTRIGALETEVDMTSANSRIDVLANEISNAHRTNVDTLDDRFDAVELRVTTLENANSSSTVVISDATYTSQGLPIIDNPDENVDYLIKKGDKYYYWKYIKTSSDPDIYTWELISGGGGSGSGNSNAEDYETYNAFELATKETNKDYYVLQSDGIRHHYRYLQSINANEETVWTRIEIGIPTSTLKSYQIARSQEIDEQTSEATEYLDLYGFDFGTDVASDDVENVPNYQNYLLAHVELPKGGGGGGDTGAHKIYAKVRGDSNMRISLDAASRGITLNYGYTCYTYDEENGYDYQSVGYTLTDALGTVIAASDGVVNYLSKADYDLGVSNISIPHIEQYCETNKTSTFILTLHSPYNENIHDRVVTVYITVVEIALTSTFTDQQTYSINNNLTIPYQFVGMSDITPTFEILLDNNTIPTTVTNTNIVIRKEALANLQGIHSLTIRAGQTISGTMLYSDPLTYQLGLIDGVTDSLMLLSGASLQTQTNEQYQVLRLPYYLYVPSGESVAVTFTVERLTYNASNVVTNREVVPELSRPTENLSTGAYTYNFRLHDMIADVEYYALTIASGSQSLVFNIVVNKAAEQINIKTDNLMFDFKPEQYSNNVEDESLRLWSDTHNGVTYKMRIPQGAHFDWRTGGWVTVDDVPCFCVKAGSRVEFVQESGGTTSPLTLFWPGMEGLGGSNFKCTFKIDNVKTPNAPFLTSLDRQTNTIINYGQSILASKQDLEDEDTLLHSYLNTKYIYTKTINSDNKVVKEAIGQTVLNNSPFSDVLNNTVRAAAEVDAKNSNKKKIKKYISNIYDIANQASTQAHREYLLQVLSGKQTTDTIDYSTIKTEITNYLFDEATYDAGSATNTNATTVYNRLVNESTDSSSVTYAYRQAEPVNFDALLNGFVVEGKSGKDGIIAMILFTFVSTVETANTYIQTVSASPISTNSFANTGTFEVQTTDANENVKTYEVEMLDEAGNGTYTEIVSIRDASNTEVRAYGLELNALGSNIYLPSGIVSYAHSEGDVIEFEYNINPEITGRVNSSIIIYEDGVPSAAKLYASRNNIFEQADPGCLTIGSDECDVYIYKMRLYSQALDNKDILANFYADGLTTEDMMSRYNRNKNLVNAVTITPQLIAEECPDLRVIMIEAPNLTGGKTSFIKNTKIRQIYKNGRPEDNWVALNAYHAGQGTSSDNYGAAGRNLDIMFGFDGIDTVIVPKPQKNNYTFDPTYKSILVKGLDEDLTNDILTAEEYEDAGYTVEYNGTGKVSFTTNSVPNNWFNIKVNIASSENTNNAYLQKRFDRYLPYETPAMKRDNKIKNDMEFFNCVVFIKETGTPSEFTEDKDLPAADRPWHFYGIGNIGDSKKTDNTRVNVEGDPYEFCIEISDNGLKNSGFSSGVYYISEQSKTRSLTPRDQVNGNMDLAVVRTATSVHVCEAAEYTVSGSSYNFSILDPSNKVLYLVPTVTDAFTYYRRFMYVNSVWTEIGEPITFTRTSYGIKYPVSEAEWNCSLNDYRKSLYDTTSGKGWDKSYEFRYDITTKDGETVARNDLEAALNNLHQQTNKKAFADLYSWIVTATDEEFNSDLNEWFIEEAPLYWYLFTERYTMIDSRAKNTFYHYGKTYISQYEYDGHVLEDLNTVTPADYLAAHPEITASGSITALQIATEEIEFKKTAAQFIYTNRDTFTLNDTQAAINDGYRYDLWDYDNDTALGINNNGQMVFSAGLEDIDKDVSGWIYNEAESVIWRRIRENMYAELGALYVELKGQCFNAENLIQEFDNMQNQFPEELWRLDFERKYYRPFIKLGETTYLNDMANGRKRYQRRQFERNMAIYINSKYQRNGSYNENDIISFRPQFTWTAGRDTQITVKPYSTMYINFMLGNDDNTGNDTVVSTRVQRGQPYVIDPIALGIHDFNNIQCIIYNASRIMELDGLGNFECKQFILGAAKKLSVLKLGSAEYTNRSMTDINNMGLSDGLPLLEELDLTNIQFGTAPDTFALDNFPLLKKLNATGCNIHSFTFKDGGMLEQIIFPSVLTKIDFKNLYNLVDTYNDQNQLVPAVTLTGAANLVNYNSINSYSNSYRIVQNMLNNAGINGITQLKLNDIDWTITNINELDPLVSLQHKLGVNMALAGIIHITGNWSTVECNYYRTELGNGITFDTTQGTQIIKYSIQYKNYDGTLLYESYKAYGEEYIDPVVEINPLTNAPYITMPQKPQDAQYSYRFGQYSGNNYIAFTGWRDADTSQLIYQGLTVTDDAELIADYPDASRVDRYYTVTWYDADDEPLYVSDPQRYGVDASNIPAPAITTAIGSEAAGYKVFKGWNRPVGTITGNIEVYPLWEQSTLDFSAPANITINDINDLNAADFYGITQIKQPATRSALLLDHLGYDLKYIEMGQDFDFDQSIIPSHNLIPANEDYIYLSGANSDVRIYDGNTRSGRTLEAIYPLTNLATDFTLAIDFKFLMDSTLWSRVTSEFVIASCYKEVNGAINGFKISLQGSRAQASSPEIRITWGDGTINETTYIKVDAMTIDSNVYNTYRNMVVLRHSSKAGDRNKLYVYYMNPSTDPKFYNVASGVTTKTLTWDSNMIIDYPLVLGATYSASASTNIESSQSRVPAKGVIYYAKYWEADLGNGNCNKLASWPHQKMAFKISGFDDGLESINPLGHLVLGDNTTNKINFTAAQPIGDRYCDHRRDSCFTNPEWAAANNYYTGWSNFDVRTFMNTTVYNAFPTVYQSLMKTIEIKSYTLKHVGKNDAGPTQVSENLQDVIYIPAYSEIETSIRTDYNGESNHAWDWLKTANVTRMYEINTGGTLVKVAPNNVENYNCLKLQFLEQPVLPTARIFKMSGAQNPYTILDNTTYVIDGETMKVRPGDIWYTGTTAYMYVSQDDVLTGAKINTDLTAANGYGWIESCIWTTRTMDINGSAWKSYSFIKTMKNGQTLNDYSVDVSTTYNRALVPQFSI